MALLRRERDMYGAVSTKIGLTVMPDRHPRFTKFWKEVILMVETVKVVRHHGIKMNLRNMSDTELDSFLSNISAHISDLSRLHDLAEAERTARPTISNVA